MIPALTILSIISLFLSLSPQHTNHFLLLENLFFYVLHDARFFFSSCLCAGLLFFLQYFCKILKAALAKPTIMAWHCPDLRKFLVSWLNFNFCMYFLRFVYHLAIYFLNYWLTSTLLQRHACIISANHCCTFRFSLLLAVTKGFSPMGRLFKDSCWLRFSSTPNY